MTATLSFKQAGLLFSSAFFIRAVVLIFCIQPNGFYKQPDSMDYHNCAVSIASGHGMHRIDTNEPIFWRTPGYPQVMAAFYTLCGLKSWRFEDNSPGQHALLWAQVILGSCIPIILFYLAMLLSSTPVIGLATAWIAVLHPGIVLASTYLLTEGLAILFFYLFLLFFFALLLAYKQKYSFWWLFGSATCLSIYTWMRPMGEFIAFFATLLLCFAAVGNWKQKVARGFLFALLFFATLTPWYIRNYQLTNEWFFCPTIGTYLNCFSVPKILRRTLNKPIEECLKIAQLNAGRLSYQKQRDLQANGISISNNICKEVAYPIIQKHPFYFLYDWTMEVLKSSFDLYSYQLIPMQNGSYWYDPIEEHLPDKIADCLWRHPLPWYARLVCWIEFFFSLFLWIGLFGGLWRFVIAPLWNKSILDYPHVTRIWLVSAIIFSITVGMTGGFGYARLRLPVEPLMLILSFMYWYAIAYKKSKELS